MPRESWSDGRLDDLSATVERVDQRMEAGFAETRAEIRATRRELREELAAMRTEFREEHHGARTEFREELRGEIGGVRSEIAGVRSEMGEIRAEIGALNRTIHQFLFAIVGTIFLGFMGTISALVTLT